MRGTNFPYSFDFNGKSREDAVLTCLSGGQTDRWSIDVPTVLWMLERVAAGDVDAQSAQECLRQAAQWDSGCCGDCDRAAPYFEEAVRRHEGLRSAEAYQDAGAGNLVLNRSRIHRSTCSRIPPSRATSWFSDLHSFAGFFDAHGDDIESVLDALNSKAIGGPRILSVLYVRNRIAREGVSAVKARLCRSCKPELPELDPADESLQPACWHWPSDRETLHRIRMASSQEPGGDRIVLAHQRVAFEVLLRWQGGRCAVCGQAPARGSLVRDHDHQSGLIRGLLCSGCNTLEGRSSSVLFERYRERSPAVILGIEVLFLPVGFEPGGALLSSKKALS